MLFWGPPSKFVVGSWKPKQEKSDIIPIENGRTSTLLLEWINKKLGRYKMGTMLLVNCFFVKSKLCYIENFSGNCDVAYHKSCIVSVTLLRASCYMNLCFFYSWDDSPFIYQKDYSNVMVAINNLILPLSFPLYVPAHCVKKSSFRVCSQPPFPAF